MRYDVIVTRDRKALNIIGNDGNVITYDVSKYTVNNLDKVTYGGVGEAICCVSNAYLATIEDDTTLMAVLSNALDTYNNMFNTMGIETIAKNQLRSFVSHPALHPDMITAWVYDNINVPDSFDKEYVADPNHTREQTYVATDYLDLVVLAIYMKLFLPFFASYLVAINDIYTKPTYELECMKIIPELVTGIPGYKKLYTYTNVYVENNTLSLPILLKHGISEEQNTDWLFSILLVKRIISGSVLNNEGKRTLVFYLYVHISNKAESTGNGNFYNDKFVGAGSDDGSDASVLEKFRYKEKVSIADQMMLREGAEDRVLLSVLKDYVDVDEYMRAADKYVKLAPTPTTTQLNLCKLVLMPYISHYSMWLLDRDEQLRKLMLAHMLIREKHPFISLLVIAHKGEQYNDVYVRKNKLSEELAKQLDEKYPYKKVKGLEHGGCITLAKLAMEDLCKNVSGWYVYVPLNSPNEVTERVDGDVLLAPTNIRELVCNFYLNIDDLTTKRV